MCMSAPDVKEPPPPPPPPPTLDQAAPEVATAKDSSKLSAQASGTKAYRSSLAIGTPTSGGSSSSGLGISM